MELSNQHAIRPLSGTNVVFIEFPRKWKGYTSCHAEHVSTGPRAEADGKNCETYRVVSFIDGQHRNIPTSGYELVITHGNLVTYILKTCE
jgi:hypothetical protein